MVSAGLFVPSVLGQLPLSLFTTGADSTLPKWLYARMVSGYTPLVPTVGMPQRRALAGAVILGGVSCGLAPAPGRRQD
jgi:spermidine/putrescine transport system permease protein